MDVLIEQHNALLKQITQKQESLDDLKCVIDGILFQLKEKEELMRTEKETYDMLIKQEIQVSQQINDELERIEMMRQNELTQMSIEDDHMHKIIDYEKKLDHDKYIESLYSNEYVKMLLNECLDNLRHINTSDEFPWMIRYIRDMVDKLAEQKIMFVNYYLQTLKIKVSGPCNDPYAYQYVLWFLCVDIYGNYAIFDSRMANYLYRRPNEWDYDYVCFKHCLDTIVNSCCTIFSAIDTRDEPFSKESRIDIFMRSVDLFKLCSGSDKLITLQSVGFGARVNLNTVIKMNGNIKRQIIQEMRWRLEKQRIDAENHKRKQEIAQMIIEDDHMHKIIECEKETRIQNLTFQLEKQFDCAKDELIKSIYGFVFSELEENKDFDKFYHYVTKNLLDKFNKKNTHKWIASNIVNRQQYYYCEIDSDNVYLSHDKIIDSIKTFFVEDKRTYEKWIYKYAHNYAMGLKDPKYIHV